ncbi:caspase-1-like isoform X1 [Aphidius gifuensis]|uniref:caspase-1-like isoform X1 n=1 Tax=Aphidius gifuensis TaxID=684658 RepID=UPI001CDBE36B|nr:caspase-1-like isoform X1 [Aphidius gifuensis]
MDDVFVELSNDMLDTERGDEVKDDMTIRQPRKRRVSDVIDSIGDDSGHDSNSFDLPSHVNGDSNENYINEEEETIVPVTPESVNLLMPEWLCKKSSQADSVPVGLPEDEGEDEDDHSPLSQNSSLLELSASMPVAIDAERYNMNHKNRGKCIVFNQETFDTGLKTRNGSSEDAKRIETTFKNLGFNVEILDDLEHTDIMKKIDELSNEDHRDNDCLCIFMLTHGLSNDLVFAKDVAYDVKKIWKPFTADKCKTLAGKPKLFFIQACRGSQLDVGVQMRQRNTEIRMNTEVDGNIDTYKLPTHADFLIAHSTVQGFYSWRNPTEGTWFVQCLCDVIDEHYTTTDLQKMLTICMRKIATEYSSYDDVNPLNNDLKQVPSITTMLLRDIYFLQK